jgi:hypothetical protein
MTTFAEILDEDVPELPEDGMLPHTLDLGVSCDALVSCTAFPVA